jgi:hypothetical protein
MTIPSALFSYEITEHYALQYVPDAMIAGMAAFDPVPCSNSREIRVVIINSGQVSA